MELETRHPIFVDSDLNYVKYKSQIFVKNS